MMFNLEKAIATWRHQFKYSRSFKGRDLDELEQHIRDQVASMMSNGADPEDAFRDTMTELGTIHETQADYQEVAWMKTRDRREIMYEVRYSFTMIKNYASVAFRNLKKNKVSSVINLVSLSVAISVAIVVYLLASNQLTKDEFHENADEIFLIHQVTLDSGKEQWWGHTPLPLGPVLSESTPEIARSVRVADAGASVIQGDIEFPDYIRFVDPQFLKMFTFPLASGTDTALREKGQVVLSQKTSNRYFGDTNPVGQTMSLVQGNNEPIEVIVSGVAAPFPANAELRFSMLMSYPSYADFGGDISGDWSTFTAATFIQLNSASDTSRVEAALMAYKDQVNNLSEEWQITGFELDNLKNLPWNRGNVRQSIAGNISLAPSIVLSLVALLLLLLSCFNYMNITIATSTRRLKEIGVRKVVGGSRGQLVFQFLAENVQLCLLSLLLGLVIASQFLLPIFNEIVGGELKIALGRDVGFWLFLVLIVVGTGLVSGAYPALYISSFRPTAIFRGREQLGRRRPLTQVFLTFQFTLAFLTLLAGIVFLLNDRYHMSMDWGYDTEHTLVFRVNDEAEFDTIERAALESPGVLQTAGSEHAIGFSGHTAQAKLNGMEETVTYLGGSRTYLNLVEATIKEGILFGDSLNLVGSEGIIVNETFARTFSLDNPIGAFVEVDSTNYAIVGVLKDIHLDDFFTTIRPGVFVQAPESRFRFVSVKVQPESAVATADHIIDSYKAAFSGREPRYDFQDRAVRAFYQQSMSITKIFFFVAIIALLISCLSIYALSAQNVVNRLKEIGVRKVLGGTASGIAQLVNRRFLYVLGVAALISTPIGYVALDALLNDIFAYHMALNPIPFLLTSFIIAGTTVLTVSLQVRTINRARPAEIMRND